MMGKNDEQRPRVARVLNPNAIVLEKIVEEENFEELDQE